MAHFAIVGTDVHRLPLHELERIAAAGREPVAFARRAQQELPGAECAALVTCNRVELIVASELPLAEEAVAAAFHHALGIDEVVAAASDAVVHSDEAGLRHLLRVACSLESAALGEEQILGQVRDAIKAARDAGVAGSRLAGAFDLALRVGKKVRRETQLADLGTDLARLALRHLKPELRSDGQSSIVLIGTGAMARSLLEKRPKDAREGWVPWVIVGRDRTRASALAAEFACAAAMTLSAFLTEPVAIRAIVAATRAEAPVISAEFVRARLPLGAGMVDLGLPRNVDPASRSHARLADLADLHALADAHQGKAEATIARIDGWIEEALARQRRRTVQGV